MVKIVCSFRFIIPLILVISCSILYILVITYLKGLDDDGTKKDKAKATAVNDGAAMDSYLQRDKNSERLQEEVRR